jgi:hypothetical protein
MGVRRLGYSQALEEELSKGISFAEAHRIAIEKSKVERPKMRIMKDPEKAWNAYLKLTKGSSRMTKKQFMRKWYPSKTEQGLKGAGVDDKMINRLMGG